MEDDLVEQLRVAGLSQTKALTLLGIAASSWQYRRRPRAAVEQPKPHDQRVGSHWLSKAEQDAIIAKLNATFADEESVYQGFHTALDAGDPVASLSSWYRVARCYLNADRPVRRTRNHRASAMPQWTADAPLQVWSWDITKLPGPYRGVNFNFYLALDVFSRKAVAWRVELHEDDALAREMFQNAFDECGAHPRVVHADGGASMTSNTLAALFTTLGIERSRNRPRVSNDNPFSESLFKTAKYRPGYPAYFESLEQARAWAEQFITWYNTCHHHSALEGHTPASMHDGSWVQVHHARQATLDRLYAEHPERYTRPPTVKPPLAQTVLNQENPKHRLQTG